MVEASTLALGGLAGQVNSNTANASKTLGETYDNFLLMLTTQLRNQDPLNPMDSKEFTSQLIQMSSAEQSIAQTSKIEEMLKMMQASTINTALNYIGLSVDYQGNNFTFDGKTAPTLGYEVPEGAVDTQVSILNSSGNVVYTAKGDSKVGQHGFVWDGKDRDGNPVKPGAYRMEVGAVDANDNALTVKTTVPGTVDGVETANGQVYLVINGEVVTIDAVKSAYAMTYYYPNSGTGGTEGNGTGSGSGTGTGSGNGSGTENEAAA